MHSMECSDLERQERGEEELQIIMAERVEAEILHMKEKRLCRSGLAVEKGSQR